PRTGRREGLGPSLTQAASEPRSVTHRRSPELHERTEGEPLGGGRYPCGRLWSLSVVSSSHERPARARAHLRHEGARPSHFSRYPLHGPRSFAGVTHAAC